MSFFELTQQLLRRYLLPTQIDVTFAGEKHQQWTAGTLTILVTETSATSTLINILSKTDVNAVPIDWEQWHLSGPLWNEELQGRFNEYLDLRLKPKQAKTTQSKPQPTETRQATQTKQNPREPSETPQKPCLAPPPQLLNTPRSISQPPVTTRPADMPDFDDEYEIQGKSNIPKPGGFSVGDRDLNPAGVGRFPQMKPYLDPDCSSSSGGMFVGRDDPMFGQASGNTSRRGVPPGARFDDPYGEDNMENLGMGLPGNLQRGLPNFPGSGQGGFGFGGGSGPNSGGFGFGGPGFI